VDSYEELLICPVTGGGPIKFIVITTPPIESSGVVLNFSSESVASVVLTSTASRIVLGEVVVPTLPSGFAIMRVDAFFKFRMMEDDSDSDNSLNGDQYVQVRLGGEQAYITFAILKDGMFGVNASSRSSGVTINGNVDLKNLITGAGTYEFSIKSALTDGDNLNLYDIQCGIRIYLKEA
jgi:hypothetical protein